MKYIITTFLLFTIFSISNAQELRINFYSSYVFDDSFDSYYDPGNYYDGKIKGGYQWGGGIEYLVNPYYGLELFYLRQDTEAPTTYLYDGGFFSNVQFTTFDMGINYIMLGGTRHLMASSGKVEGFAGLAGGMVVASLRNPENGREDTATKLAWGVRAGGNIWATEKLGLKIQFQLLSAVQSMGGGFYFGTGGSGAGVSSYSTIYQFCMGGGLVYRVEM